MFTQEQLANLRRWFRFRSFKSSRAQKSEPESILLQNQLWFGAAEKMDDLSEGNPRTIYDQRLGTLEMWIERARGQMPFANYRECELQAQHRMQALEPLDARMDRLEEVARRELNIYRKRAPICSFSPDVSCLRYWGQYADNGKGYALEFDFSQPWPIDVAGTGQVQGFRPAPVQYPRSKKRPTLLASFIKSTDDENEKEVTGALLTKSRVWRDQQEGRIVRYNVAPGPVTFPAHSLVNVYFGHAMGRKRKSRLKRLCDQRQRSIGIYETSLSPTHFLIDVNFLEYRGG